MSIYTGQSGIQPLRLGTYGKSRRSQARRGFARMPRVAPAYLSQPLVVTEPLYSDFLSTTETVRTPIGA